LITSSLRGRYEKLQIQVKTVTLFFFYCLISQPQQSGNISSLVTRSSNALLNSSSADTSELYSTRIAYILTPLATLKLNTTVSMRKAVGLIYEEGRQGMIKCKCPSSWHLVVVTWYFLVLGID
ncbi:hypothetical protein BpHYR1_011099, partial [Brachionus plicatilis]